MKKLKSVQDVVNAFGGAKATAKWGGVSESAVLNWIARGFIPPAWHFRLQHHFKPRSFELCGSVFNQTLKSVPHRKPETSEIRV